MSKQFSTGDVSNKLIKVKVLPLADDHKEESSLKNLHSFDLVQLFLMI